VIFISLFETAFIEYLKRQLKPRLCLLPSYYCHHVTLRASGLTGLNICTLQISVLLVLGRASQYYVRLRLIVTDRVAWSVGRSVDRFVTVVRPIPFGL